MDIRPTGLPIPATSALDALHRVRSSAAAGDSEDSQTGGYLFGDGSQGEPGKEDSGDEPGNADQVADRVVVEISAAVLAEHAISAEQHGASVVTPQAGGMMETPIAESQSDVGPASESTRHINLEA